MEYEVACEWCGTYCTPSKKNKVGEMYFCSFKCYENWGNHVMFMREHNPAYKWVRVLEVHVDD